MNTVTDRKRSDVYQDVLEALASLEASTGLTAVLNAGRSMSGGEGKIRVRQGGASWAFNYLLKRDIDRFSKLFLLRERAAQEDALLVCNPLSVELAQYCREHGIQFIDAAGNCHLRRDGLFAFVCGLKADSVAYAAEPPLTPAALRLMFAALTEPAILNQSYRTIAPAAMIATGSVGSALHALQSLGLVTELPHGSRMIMSAEKMLHMWAMGYAGVLRPKMRRQRFASETPLDQIIDTVRLAAHQVLIGGDAAAALTHRLKPASLTLYVNTNEPTILTDLVRKLRLKKDPAGPIEVAPIFWNTEALPSFPHVPSALVYADLLIDDDSRGIEIAQSIAQQITAHVEGSR